MKKKYHFTEEMDDEIRRVYRDEIDIKTRRHTGYLKALAKRLEMPPWMISKRATQIGALATQKKEPNWTQKERDILQRVAHLSLHRIQFTLKRNGYPRTQQGIQIERKKQRFLQKLNGHSARSVARCFGVDPKTVQRWISVGWLKATQRDTSRTPRQGEIFYIKDKWIRDFVVDSISIIDFRKVDKYWLVDLLTN